MLFDVEATPLMFDMLSLESDFPAPAVSSALIMDYRRRSDGM